MAQLYMSIFFVDENGTEEGDNLVFSLHPIPVSTISEFMICTKKKKEKRVNIVSLLFIVSHSFHIMYEVQGK